MEGAGGRMRGHRPRVRWLAQNLFHVVVLVSLLDQEGVAQQDRSLSLNGEWLIQVRSGALGSLPEGGWGATPIRIPSPFNANAFTNGHGPDFRSFPSYPEHWGYARSAWMQRTFSVPLQWSYGRIFLRFEAVNLHSVVYVDGRFVGENWDGYLPFEFEVTDLVTPGGTHTLTVGAESPELFRQAGGRIPAPHGSFWGLHDTGIWQDVSLHLRPDVRLEDLWVYTSVREQTLTTVLTVRNERDYPIGAQVWCAARPLGDAPSGPVWFSVLSVAAGEVKTVTLTVDMLDARLWSPEDPFLYRFEADLLISGVKVHGATTRFGFREFWIDGPHFMLNGTPIKLRGDAWHWMGIPYQNREYARLWFETARSLNINAIRLHAQVYPQFYLDLADEMGIMIIDESAWWASGLDCLYSQEGWDRLADQLARLVIRDRGHPSVVLWSLANEIIAAARTGDMLGGTAGYLEGMGRLKSIVQAQDGTRPFYAEGDADGFGLFDMVSFHYPGPQEGNSLEAWRRRPRPVSAGEAGMMFYATPPLVAWALGPEVYTDYQAHLTAAALDLRRLLQNYRLWIDHVSPFNLPWYALEPLQFAGDPIEWPDLSLPGVKPERIGPYTSTLNAGYDPALPEFVPNPVYDAIREEMVPVRVVSLDRQRHFFSNSPVSREAYVINDLSRSATYAFQWEEDIEGQTRLIREETVSLGPAEDTRLSWEWQFPSVSEVQDGTWICTLHEHESEVYRMEVPFTLLPSVLSSPDLDTPEIGYFDPSASPPMTAFGVSQWTILDSLSGIPPQVRTLLVGAAARLDSLSVRNLMEFISLGGRAVVCQRNSEVLPPYAVEEVTYGRYPGSYTYRNMPHIVAEEFAAKDLRLWSNTPMFTVAWRSFAVGNSRVLLSAGNGDAVVVDIPIGQGHLVMSQANTGEAETETPGGLRFLAEALRFAHAARPASAEKAAYLGPRGSMLHAFLYALGADLDVFGVDDPPESLGPIRRVIIDASDRSWVEQIGAGWQASLADLVETGGTIVLWGLNSDTVTPLRFVLPESPSLWNADHPHLVVEGESLAAFVHPGTLYWLDGPEAGASVMQSGIVRGPTFKGRVDHLVAAEFDWRALAYEGEPTRTSAILRAQREPNLKPVPLSALSTWQVGSGTVAVCQLRSDLLTRKNEQLVSTVLTNLGVRIHPFVPAPDVVPDFCIDWRDLFVLATGWTGTSEGGFDETMWPWGIGGSSDLLSFVGQWHQMCGQLKALPGPAVPSSPPVLTTYDTRLTPEEYLRLQETR